MAKGGAKNFRSAGTGQFVTKGFALTHPATTLAETRGGGSTHGAHRSAKSDQFVTESYAKSRPKTTIRDG